ncbi:ribonuclease D [Orbaceae bacterium ESL0721]|nr:ribonuclease D [Orbaceae bacterium ESL0721]
MSSTYRIIKTDEELTNYCSGIKDRIAIDTEFIRIRTFYPKLGLIQLFDGESIALVDPLTITVWDPFVALLADHHIQKYLHACSEDIDVFQHYFDLIPTPIIDSQILASFLDNPLSTGYATLVKKYLGVELDKSEVRTNWLQRPLTDKQCAYAINDVLYLIPLVERLKALLLDSGWLNAAYEECELAVDRKRIVIDPNYAYLQIKNGWQLNGKGLALLQRLASWRYNLAKSCNIALNFVLQEELLWKIARYKPSSLAELASLGLKGKDIRLYGEKILALLYEPIIELPHSTHQHLPKI